MIIDPSKKKHLQELHDLLERAPVLKLKKKHLQELHRLLECHHKGTTILPPTIR